MIQIGRMTGTAEKYYNITQVKERFPAVGRETLRKLFKDEVGVLHIRLGKKQSNTSYAIPESAIQRVITRLAKAA